MKRLDKGLVLTILLGMVSFQTRAMACSAESDTAPTVPEVTTAYCDDLSLAYEETLEQIRSLPKLKPATIDWKQFYSDLQVTDTSNRVSCVGHAVARALSLTRRNQGVESTPSPEFIYDVGMTHQKLFREGTLSYFLAGMSQSEKDAQIRILQNEYDKIVKEKGKPGFNYDGASPMALFDYLGQGFAIPERSEYGQHFQGGVDLGKRSDQKIDVLNFPPVKMVSMGLTSSCYAYNSNKKRLKSLAEEEKVYSLQAKRGGSSQIHLADFDFRLVDESLDRGYFPMLGINTDALKKPLSLKNVAYDKNGSIDHMFTVVGRGEDSKGVYYEILDSWVDENIKEEARARKKKFSMRKYRIYQSNLKNKVLDFSLIK